MRLIARHRRFPRSLYLAAFALFNTATTLPARFFCCEYFFAIAIDWWPDYPDDPQAYGYTEEPLRLDPASARDVSDYEVALELSMLLDVEERRVLWVVVHSAAFRTRGAQWRSLSRKMGVAAPTVRRRFEYAVLHLWQLIGHMATRSVSNGAKSDNL